MKIRKEYFKINAYECVILNYSGNKKAMKYKI